MFTVSFLSHSNALLIGAACTSVGLFGKSAPLPLDNGKSISDSPDAKRPSSKKITKMDLVNSLLDVMKNNKLTSKLREKAAKALGLICVGEVFPYTRDVIQGLLSTAKEVSLIMYGFKLLVIRHKIIF